MPVDIVLAYDRPDDIRTLFAEYTDMLVASSPAFADYLTLQDYDAELDHLEVKYGLPDGRLYLACVDGHAAGCVALRRLDGERCEMKRLYVKDRFRGMHIGSLLINRIVEDARNIGYTSMLLDTLPFLTSALHLYERHGFRRIERYNESPLSETIYMELDLKVR